MEAIHHCSPYIFQDFERGSLLAVPVAPPMMSHRGMLKTLRRPVRAGFSPMAISEKAFGSPAARSSFHGPGHRHRHEGDRKRGSLHLANEICQETCCDATKATPPLFLDPCKSGGGLLDFSAPSGLPFPSQRLSSWVTRRPPLRQVALGSRKAASSHEPEYILRVSLLCVAMSRTPTLAGETGRRLQDKQLASCIMPGTMQTHSS